MYTSLLTVALCATRVLSHSPNQYYFDPIQHLAGVTPPFDILDPPLDPTPPQGCNVTRAAYLVRHAAIFANDFDYETYIEPFVQKLGNTSVDWTKVPVLNFLATWQNPITDAEQEMLTRSGKLEASRLGVDVAQRYQKLRTPKKIWTSTAERTVKSAKSFSSGIADDASDVRVVEISEGEEEGASSLTPYKSCPAYSSSAGSKQSTVCFLSPFSFSQLTTPGIPKRLHQTRNRPLQHRRPSLQLHRNRHLRHVPPLRLRNCNTRLFTLLLPRRPQPQRMARLRIYKRHNVPLQHRLRLPRFRRYRFPMGERYLQHFNEHTKQRVQRYG